MALTAERLEGLARYCGVQDPTEEDIKTLEELYHAAMGDLYTAGVKEPAADTLRRAQYDLLVNAIVCSEFDLRGAQVDRVDQRESLAFRRRLNQLKQSEPPWALPGAEV